MFKRILLPTAVLLFATTASAAPISLTREVSYTPTQLWAQVSPASVPEPATLALLGAALLALGTAARRRINSTKKIRTNA